MDSDIPIIIEPDEINLLESFQEDLSSIAANRTNIFDDEFRKILHEHSTYERLTKLEKRCEENRRYMHIFFVLLVWLIIKQIHIV